jgi:hypothetical protein
MLQKLRRPVADVATSRKRGRRRGALCLPELVDPSLNTLDQNDEIIIHCSRSWSGTASGTVGAVLAAWSASRAPDRRGHMAAAGYCSPAGERSEGR